MSGKHDRASELRAIADGRLLLNVRNGVTVSRALLAMIADELEAERAAYAETNKLLAGVRDDAMRADNELCAMDARIAELEAENERLRRLVMAQSRAIHFPEALSRTGAVKVKALEWEEITRARSNEDPSREVVGWEASEAVSASYYTVELTGGGASMTDPDYDEKHYDDPDVAKAAAQADFERRILSALEPAAPEGQQEPVAWGVFYRGKIVAVSLHKSPHYSVPLYTRPSEQAVTEAWRPIETAPKDGTQFQAWIEKYGWEPRARFNPDSEAFELWGRVDYDKDGWDVYSHMVPTHWMPLPTPPAKAQEGK